MNRQLKLVIKISVSLFLLGFILLRVDFPELTTAIKQISLTNLSAILCLSLIFISLAAQRSRIAVEGMKKFKLGLMESYIYYLRAMFYSNMLPGAIGGDVFRVYLINKRIGDLYISGASVLSERICGLAATLILSLSAAVILWIIEGSTRFLVFVLLAVTIMVVLLIMIFNNTAWMIMERCIKLIGLNGLFEKIRRFIQPLRDLRNDSKLLIKLIIWSILYQLSDIFIAYLLGSTVGMTPGFVFYLLFIPLVYIITLIPISLNGLGVRENTLVYLFSSIGVLEHQSLFLSLLIYLDRLIKGILGGLLGMVVKEDRPL